MSSRRGKISPEGPRKTSVGPPVPPTPRTFLVISPYCRYLSQFLRGLCTPDFGTDRRLPTNGPSSSVPVSGTVQTAGAFLSRGFGIVMVLDDPDHSPPTMLDTAWGVGSAPRADGSSVAQRGRAERDRRRRSRAGAPAAAAGGGLSAASISVPFRAEGASRRVVRHVV